MPTLSAHKVPIEQLRASPRNARQHPPEQIHQLADTIRARGFGAPIIADDSGVILAGHGRWLAAIEAGLEVVPVVRVSGISEDAADAFRLLDNRLGELSLWDPHALKQELEALRQLTSLDDLQGLLDSISLTMPAEDLRDLLPLTNADLDAFISRARSDFAAELSGGFDSPPRSLLDCIDTTEADAILSDPALPSCTPDVQRLIRAAAARLHRIDYRAVRAYYQAAPAGSAIRAALIRHHAVLPISSADSAAYLHFFDALADALRADFASI